MHGSLEIARMQRTVGHGRLALKSALGRTRLDGLFQEGSAKIRLPKTYGSALEGVLINTSGGLTGGDVMTWEIAAGANTSSVITTQACEKIYKSASGVATVSASIKVGEGAMLDWLPQETILFDRSALHRTLEVDLAADARFLGLEAVMLGRDAMGEQVRTTDFHERWRIRRAGRLVHADDLRLAGDVERVVNQAATLNGHAAFASLVYCGPEEADVLSNRVDGLRGLAQNLGIGVSAMDGKITARFLAQDAYELRRVLLPFLEGMRAALGADRPLPKVWNL